MVTFVGIFLVISGGFAAKKAHTPESMLLSLLAIVLGAIVFGVSMAARI